MDKCQECRKEIAEDDIGWKTGVQEIKITKDGEQRGKRGYMVWCKACMAKGPHTCFKCGAKLDPNVIYIAKMLGADKVHCRACNPSSRKKRPWR